MKRIKQFAYDYWGHGVILVLMLVAGWFVGSLHHKFLWLVHQYLDQDMAGICGGVTWMAVAMVWFISAVKKANAIVDKQGETPNEHP